jgi:hypothetical protein
MPWWVVAYLVILTLIITIELIRNFRDHRGPIYVLAELTSGTIGWLFVYAYFSPSLQALIGWLAIPLLLYIIIWDQYALSQMKKSAYADLSEHENKDMDLYSKLFAFLFISPCYVSGALISWQLINTL